MSRESPDLPILTPTDGVPSRHLDESEETTYQLHRRYDRFARLVGEPGVSKLRNSHVMIIGLGGVGGPAAESIVRSGVGRVTLVDFDRVCVTNTNRQVQALKGNIGRPKADTLAERLRLINPQARVDAVGKFYSASTSDELLGLQPDYIIDAIDNMTAKSHLLDTSRAKSLRVVTSLGASGRLDPTQVQCVDLARTKRDPMGRVLRKILRQKYGFNRSGLFGIEAVYSTETPREPEDLTYDGGLGFRCVCPGGNNDLHSCEKRRVIYGTASFVTGTFGLFCASIAVRGLLEPVETPVPDHSNSTST
jgi:tRNA A37 threonylcarbamoyladenosine dehydratase